MHFEITKIGQRGQVVIPQSFREEMELQKGDKFMVIQNEDMLLLKRLKEPTIEEFDRMLKKSHLHAKNHSLNKKDLKEAIKKARRK